MYDATRGVPTHLGKLYSPECVEGRFAELRPETAFLEVRQAALGWAVVVIQS
jgi:hypothetical protein